MIEFSWDKPEQIVSRVHSMLRDRGREISNLPERAVRRGALALRTAVAKEFQKLARPAAARLKGVQSSIPNIIRTLNVKIERLPDGTVVATIGTNQLLARWLEEGTGLYGPFKRKYVIRPRVRKALFWGKYEGTYKSGPKAGQPKPVYRKKVLHPGMRPRQPFAKAIVAFLPRYVEIILEELDREASR